MGRSTVGVNKYREINAMLGLVTISVVVPESAVRATTAYAQEERATYFEAAIAANNPGTIALMASRRSPFSYPLHAEKTAWSPSTLVKYDVQLTKYNAIAEELEDRTDNPPGSDSERTLRAKKYAMGIRLAAICALAAIGEL